MSVRFGSNLVLAMLAGLLVTVSLAFAPATTKWLVLGGGRPWERASPRTTL